MWQVERLPGLLYSFADLTQLDKNDYKYLIPFTLHVNPATLQGLKKKLQTYCCNQGLIAPPITPCENPHGDKTRLLEVQHLALKFCASERGIVYSFKLCYIK